MRIRIQQLKLMRIHADPDPKPWLRIRDILLRIRIRASDQWIRIRIRTYDYWVQIKEAQKTNYNGIN